jgi:hypothetical protein
VTAINTSTKSRHAVDGKIHVIRKGLAVYKVRASPYYRVRVWVPSERRYMVRSTKEKSRIHAIDSAEEVFEELKHRKVVDAIPKSRLFKTYADKLIDRQKQKVADREMHPRQAKNDESLLLKEGGLVPFFGKRDVATIKTSDLKKYFEEIRTGRSKKYSPSTLNKKVAAFRKVLKIAYEEGVIQSLPETPTSGRQDNPRPFFKFEPLVPKERDEYQMLLRGAKELAEAKVKVRGVPITAELYDFILFMVHSFLRPTESEVFALMHKHVTVATDPDRLILTIAEGKTGYRVINTLEAPVYVFKRIQRRFPNHSPDDYLFLPSYKNRTTAVQVMNRQFNHLLSTAKIQHDSITNQKHTVYSLRHTAICLRIIKSGGKVNIYNLAKTAGTKVEQIERFYARNLPLSPEMARNLQTFGTD